MTNEDITIELTKHTEEIGSLKHRVNELEDLTDTIHKLALSVNELAVNMKNMIKEQETQGKRIETLEQMPVKRYDTITTVIITALVSGIISYILANILQELVNMKDYKKWLKAAGVRAVKTAAQTFVATIGSAAIISAVDWKVVASASILAAVLSLATSLAGLPELED